eukprot:m.7369 g.7369  ORF g.7369 m.7369 type:complete len:343 (+) comp2441_c0_seq1:63-1091(+)
MGLPNWFYLLAALQWGILAPLNLIKVLRNKPTKMAYLFVPEATEQCQKDCGIAQMWATLFWSSQIAMSLGYLHIYLYKSAKVPLVPIAVVQKILVGLLLIKAHKDGTVHSPPMVGGVLDIAVACMLLLDVTLPFAPPLDDAEAEDDAVATTTESKETKSGIVRFLVQFAAKPWYPWVVGALSGLNNFVMVLSGPLVVLYLSGVLANPSRRYVAAFANAAGTTAGVAVLIYLLTQNEGYIKEAFPSVFTHPTWAKTEWAVETYGWFGAFFISIQPVFLQPLVAVCCLANMSKAVLVACVLAGRTLKYIVMAELAVAGDRRLGFFGSAALDAATSFKEGKKKDE